MGVTIGPTYTTEHGIELTPMYISITNVRILPIGNGNFQLTYIFEAYKSREIKKNGGSPIQLTYGMNISDVIIPASEFATSSIFSIGYQTLQGKFENYIIDPIFEPGQIKLDDYKYNADGFDINGFNTQGYDKDGYDKDGYNSQGYDKDGYDQQGYNSQGYNKDGYNQQGYNSQGYNSQGYDSAGYNSAGYDINGYDIAGFDNNGYNQQGYDRDGYNRQGYNASGYDKDGYNSEGFNANGLSMNGGYDTFGKLPDGTYAPLPSTIMVYNTLFPDNIQSYNVRIDPSNLQNYITNLTNQIVAKEAELSSPPS